MHTSELADLDQHDMGNPNDDVVGKPAGPSLLTRWQDKSHSLQRLEENYERLGGLIESIQKHLQTQDDRTRKIADALSSLAAPVAKLPESLRRQEEQLAAIAEQLECANERSARFEATLAELPKVADAQRQTLLAVRDEIESAKKTQDRLADSMSGFRDAVAGLTQSSTASLDTLKGLQSTAGERDERLVVLLTEHNRKFSRLFTVAIVLAAVLAAATVASLFIR